MSKRPTMKPTPVQVPDPTLIVPHDIFALLASGHTRTVMTWKEFDVKPERVKIETPGYDTQLVCLVKHMDRQGHGYLPDGWPEAHRTNGQNTRLLVEILHVKEDNLNAGPANITD